MREIKFRAWDCESRHLLDWEDICSDVETEGFPMFDHIFRQDHYILMQYTGLKDKNGVEIYEGDILEASGDSGKVIRAGRFSVRWDINCFSVPRLSWLYFVIGNIYQDPDLL